MKIQSIAAVLALAALAAAQDKIMFTVEVTRHCARQSGETFEFAKDPAQEYNAPKMCTLYGVQQQYKNGESLRTKLNLTSPSEVYTQTTDAQRTLDSARSQLEGLFNKPLAWPKVVTPWVLNSVPETQDYIIHLGEDNCPRFEQVTKAIEADPSVVKLLEEVNQDLEVSFFPELRKLTNMPDADTEKMNDVCNYIYWSTLSGLELKFKLTEEQLNMCLVSQQKKVFANYGDKELTMLPVYEFLTTLRDMTKVQRGQMTLAQSQTFMKYYNLMPGAKLEKTPKLILYSAHSETLGPILRYFKAEDKVPFTPEPSSMILFDFYEGADARIVAKYVASS